mgnify:CR=1 FL=1
MGGTIVAVIAAFAVFVVLWLVLSRQKKREDKPDTYVCTECNEQNCNCYREDEIPKRKD